MILNTPKRLRRFFSKTESPAYPLPLVAAPDGQHPNTGHGLQEGANFTVSWAWKIGKNHVARGTLCEDAIALNWLCTAAADPAAECLHVAVADGVSGGACGNIASSAAANHLVGLRPENDSGGILHEDSNDFFKVIIQTDAVVQSAVARYSSHSGATTFSTARVSASGAGVVCRVGDCRTFKFSQDIHRDLKLEQLQEDQNYYFTKEIPDRGIPFENPSRMAGLGRFMGEPEILPINLLPGEGLLLTSDGVHGFVSAEILTALIARGLYRENMGAICNRIIQEACEKDSHDDLSVLILRRKASACEFQASSRGFDKDQHAMIPPDSMTTLRRPSGGVSMGQTVGGKKDIVWPAIMFFLLCLAILFVHVGMDRQEKSHESAIGTQETSLKPVIDEQKTPAAPAIDEQEVSVEPVRDKQETPAEPAIDGQETSIEPVRDGQETSTVKEQTETKTDQEDQVVGTM